MVIIGATLTSAACWGLFADQKTTVSQQAFGCHIGLLYDTPAPISWEALFVYDSMAFALTLFKIWREGRNIKIRVRRLPLITLLLRDGATYFAAVALANLANILTFYLCGVWSPYPRLSFILFTNDHQPFLQGGLSAFSCSISVIMMSRFMLNLHENASIGIFSTQISTSDDVSRLEFAQNLAESRLSEDSVIAGAGSSGLE
ncbi:hypothetical protein BD779DRAFT_178023 [Infundibulicybe gibba]|nr:hypothetical protein BD779DRAFT_178023 [Infundibulicybe gibba]